MKWRDAAFAVSLSLHAAVLFAPGVGALPSSPKAPLLAELRPAQPSVLPPPHLPAAARVAGKTPEARRLASRKTASSARRVLAVPGDDPSVPVASPEFSATNENAPEASRGEADAPALAERLPPRGRIRFRVDRGDSGFEIGLARQEWFFEQDRYRLVSSVETTGLAWLIRSVDIDMESIGRMSGGGLQPEAFGVMRSGQKARERALFDWEMGQVRVGADRDHALDAGAQDLLSFYYQLGFLDIVPGQSVSMPLATGKKYSVYRLEYVADETVDTPLGALRARHLRTLGEKATEIWLAYEYRLLPVKIRHVDNKGDAFVQTATEILFGP